jgi:SAM-dependent methyltransferase
MKAIKTLVHRLGRYYCIRLCRKEHESQRFIWINERPIEYAFVFKQITRLYPRTILDVGTGTTALPHLMRNCGPCVTAIDNIRDYWPSGMFNRHYFVLSDDIRNSKLNTEFDLITCISVLEHIPESDQAVNGMFKLLKTGGHLVLTFPYNEKGYCANVYKLPNAGYGQDSPYICQAYSRDKLVGWLLGGRSRIIEQEYWQMFTGTYWTVGSRLLPARQVTVEDVHQLTCLLIQKQ